MSGSFHPLVEAWFRERYGEPTPVQREAWPLILGGENVLALAPTGSGKTLTAFLAALSRFADGSWPTGELSVVYVSPLKALNEDIARNLLEPLASLEEWFAARGEVFPSVRVETRSGDTPPSKRRRFLAMPPEILATTPESLAILLLSPRGRAALGNVRYLVLDEVHAELGNKRGVFLSCQVDRLAGVSLSGGEFQRVGLSATVRPPEAAAEFVGGLRLREGRYEPRPVRIAAPPAEKKILLRVEFPEPAFPGSAAGGVSGDGADTGAGGVSPEEEDRIDRYGRRYTVLVDRILERIGVNRSVLVFTDSRQRAERIALLVNQRGEGRPSSGQSGEGEEEDPREQLAWTHHGSLSREIRQAVERNLAEGRLPCVVATSSLELGIDIGSVDEVILAGTPGSASAAIQRIGRSGHQTGGTSRGTLVPFNGPDLLQAAAAAGAVEEREIERLIPIENPLDILAQVILELCVERKRNIDNLYQTLRGFYAFRNLPRDAYDRTVRMLAGYHSEDRIRELGNRLYHDRETGDLEAAAGTQLLLYTSGGVIANRGYYSLRLADGTKIGELDEEFVWERRLGDNFEFGSRSWVITAIGSEAVTAVPGAPSDFAPFYHAEAVFRSPVLVRRTLELLEEYEGAGSLDPEDFSPDARLGLNSFLETQRAAQRGIPLPGPGHIPVEVLDDPVLRPDSFPVLFHSFRGGAVNHPLSIALAQNLEETTGLRVENAADDNGVLVMLPRAAREAPETLLERSLAKLAGSAWGEDLFRRRLAGSGIFGAAFREAAERGMILSRPASGRRLPLWITRERSRRLFDAVADIDDFPITTEAWRVCLEDRFDLRGFAALLRDLAGGNLKLSFFRRQTPSPFARSFLWQETGRLMYQYDERADLRDAAAGGRVSLADRIIREALEGKAERPPLPERLVEDFCSRLRREREGWTPQDETSLAEWVRERTAIPEDEWETLRGNLPEGLREALRGDPGLGGRIVPVLREGAAVGVLVHRDMAAAWSGEALELLGTWLRFQGPLGAARIRAVFGSGAAETEAALGELEGTGTLTRGVRIRREGTEDPEDLVCDRENLELLLRLLRKKARPQVAERPLSVLTPLLARRQGLLGGEPGTPPWERLRGCPLPASLWESDVFPARDASWNGAALDRELGRGGLLWFGAGRERLGFAAGDELDLFLPEAGTDPGAPAGAIAELAREGFLDRPREFQEIRDRLGLDTVEAAEILWEAVWGGLVSSDSFDPVRRGLEQGFVPKKTLEEAARSFRRHGRIPRALRARRGSQVLSAGRWYHCGLEDEDPLDPLEAESLDRERVRLLLDRWGILARPFLEREWGALSWGRLLPALRRMELAGEVAAGRYLGGINSLQFARPGIARELEAAEAERGVYWMNALDPASPAGLDGSLAGGPRLSSIRLCFRGAELAARSRRNGRELAFFVPPDDPGALSIAGFLLPGRRGKIAVETINGVPALKSPWGAALRESGFVPAPKGLVLYQ